MRWLHGITDSVDMFEQALGESGHRGAWRSSVHGVLQRVRHDLAAEQQPLSQTNS